MAIVVMEGMCVQSITAIHNYQQLIGCSVGNGLRLFVVGGKRIAMAMVVVGHILSWSYTTYLN